MKREGIALLKSEGIKEEDIKYVYSLDLRYVKQYHEVNVVIDKKDVESGDFLAMVKKFHPKHNMLYGYSLEEEGTPVELINMRLITIGRTIKPKFLEEPYTGADPSPAFKRKRKVFLPMQKGFANVDVFDGDKLHFGNRIEGPAIIEQVNTTTFVTPEYNVLVDKYGSYTMFLKEKEDEVKRRIMS